MFDTFFRHTDANQVPWKIVCIRETILGHPKRNSIRLHPPSSFAARRINQKFGRTEPEIFDGHGRNVPRRNRSVGGDSIPRKESSNGLGRNDVVSLIRWHHGERVRDRTGGEG